MDDFLQRQPLLAAINGLIAALTALAPAGTAPPGVLLVWLLAMLVAQASCLALWLAVRFHPALTAQRLAELLTLASALTGLVWGSAGVVLVHHDAHRPPSWCRSCWPACRRARSPPCRRIPAFFVFIWAALVPYALQLGASPDACPDGRHHPALRRGLVPGRLAGPSHLAARGRAGLQNATLVHRLDDARQGLEATVATRTMELRATNAALLREVAERRRSEDRVRHLLAHDPLTNLPNRLLLLDRIQQALARSTRYGTKTAVVIFDIDRFKDVNDSLDPAGDRLLRDLADRVQVAVRGSDTVAESAATSSPWWRPI